MAATISFLVLGQHDRFIGPHKGNRKVLSGIVLRIRLPRPTVLSDSHADDKPDCPAPSVTGGWHPFTFDIQPHNLKGARSPCLYDSFYFIDPYLDDGYIGAPTGYPFKPSIYINGHNILTRKMEKLNIQIFHTV